MANSYWRDSTQRAMPGGQTGREPGRRSNTDYLGALIGGSLVPILGSALGGEAGERFGHTAVGNFINHPFQSIGNMVGGGNSQSPYTGTQLNSNLNTSIWNINPNLSSQINGYGLNGNGAREYHGNTNSPTTYEQTGGDLVGQYGEARGPGAPTSAPQAAASYDNGWRNGAGGTGQGGGWRTITNASQMAMLGAVLEGAKGNLGSAMGRTKETEYDTSWVGKDGKEHTIGGDSRLLSHAPHASNGPTTAQGWIAANPEAWKEMKRQMRDRG